MNKLFSLATEATIFVQTFSLLKKHWSRCGLCTSNLSDPSVERTSTPTKGPCLRRHWQTISILNLAWNFVRNTLIWRHCEKVYLPQWLSCLWPNLPTCLATADYTGKSFPRVFADGSGTNYTLLSHCLNSQSFDQFQAAAKAISRGKSYSSFSARSDTAPVHNPDLIIVYKPHICSQFNGVTLKQCFAWCYSCLRWALGAVLLGSM